MHYLWLPDDIPEWIFDSEVFGPIQALHRHVRYGFYGAVSYPDATWEYMVVLWSEMKARSRNNKLYDGFQNLVRKQKVPTKDLLIYIEWAFTSQYERFSLYIFRDPLSLFDNEWKEKFMQAINAIQKNPGKYTQFRIMFVTSEGRKDYTKLFYMERTFDDTLRTILQVLESLWKSTAHGKLTIDHINIK